MTYLALDTNILVSALWRKMRAGKPALLLRLCIDAHYTAVYTQAVFQEYQEVLSRSEFGFSQQDLEVILGFFRHRALSADPLFPSLSRPQCSDRSDQAFYDVACCCDAILITGNKKHFPADARVLTPAEFLGGRHLSSA